MVAPETGKGCSMIKKTVFTVMWTVIFFFGSAVVLGALSGLLFASVMKSGGSIPPDGSLVRAVGLSWAIVPMVLGPVGLLLGILGKLPGTELAKAAGTEK